MIRRKRRGKRKLKLEKHLRKMTLGRKGVESENRKERSRATTFTEVQRVWGLVVIV